MSDNITIMASSNAAENKIRVIDDVENIKRVRGPATFEHPNIHYYQRAEGKMQVDTYFEAFDGVANRAHAIEFAKQMVTKASIVEVWAIPSSAPGYAVGVLV